jgi:hypothetical protein
VLRLGFGLSGGDGGGTPTTSPAIEGWERQEIGSEGAPPQPQAVSGVEPSGRRCEDDRAT